MNKRSKVIFFATIACGCISLSELLLAYAFPKVTFVTGGLAIANSIASYFAFSFFAVGLLLLFKVNRFVTAPVIVTLLFLCLLHAYFQIHPIDTTTEPVDKALLRTDEKGNKLVAREYKNAKTNGVIQDTVLVKDFFIFRQIIKSKGNLLATNR